MDKQIESRLDRLNKKLVLLFGDLQHYSDATLNKRPSQDAWSVLEVMQHLYLSEKQSLTSVEQEIEKQTVFAKAGIADSFRAMALSTVLSLPIKYKAPFSINREAFISDPTFWEVAKDWKNERSRLKHFLNSLPNDFLSKSIYKHPSSGLMTLSGMLAFYESHFNRHLKQIHKTLKAIDAVKQL